MSIHPIATAHLYGGSTKGNKAPMLPKPAQPHLEPLEALDARGVLGIGAPQNHPRGTLSKPHGIRFRGPGQAILNSALQKGLRVGESKSERRIGESNAPLGRGVWVFGVGAFPEQKVELVVGVMLKPLRSRGLRTHQEPALPSFWE